MKVTKLERWQQQVHRLLAEASSQLHTDEEDPTVDLDQLAGLLEVAGALEAVDDRIAELAAMF